MKSARSTPQYAYGRGWPLSGALLLVAAAISFWACEWRTNQEDFVTVRRYDSTTRKFYTILAIAGDGRIWWLDEARGEGLMYESRLDIKEVDVVVDGVLGDGRRCVDLADGAPSKIEIIVAWRGVLFASVRTDSGYGEPSACYRQPEWEQLLSGLKALIPAAGLPYKDDEGSLLSELRWRRMPRGRCTGLDFDLEFEEPAE